VDQPGLPPHGFPLAHGFPLGGAICLRGDHFQRVQQLQRHSEAAASVLPGWVKRRFQHLRHPQWGAFNRASLLQNIAFIKFSLSCSCLPSLSAGEQKTDIIAQPPA